MGEQAGGPLQNGSGSKRDPQLGVLTSIGRSRRSATVQIRSIRGPNFGVVVLFGFCVCSVVRSTTAFQAVRSGVLPRQALQFLTHPACLGRARVTFRGNLYFSSAWCSLVNTSAFHAEDAMGSNPSADANFYSLSILFLTVVKPIFIFISLR